MAKIIFYSMVLVLLACNNKVDTQEVNFSSTEELHRGGADVISYSRRKNKDLVSHLYKQALDRDAKLEAIEKRIEKISNSKKDSLAQLYEYIRYNELYYQSTLRYSSAIQDSVKRKSIESFLVKSKKAFEKGISDHVVLSNMTTQLEMNLSDQHNLLKLIVSEKLMSDYQSIKPKTDPIKAINKQIEVLLDETEAYTEIGK